MEYGRIVILPAASFATSLSDLNPVFAAVAAVAAVIALYFARKTVVESDAARREGAIQHSEQMDGMKGLSDSMRAAATATAKQEQIETEHRQVAQVQRIAELLLQTVEAADAEAERPRLHGAPPPLSLMLQTIATAKNAWLATADLDLNRNPAAADLLALRPELIDADNPREVSTECASALMAINASWGKAMLKRAERQLEQTQAVVALNKEVREAGDLPRYLLKLLASEGPKTEADLKAAVHIVPNFEQLIPSWVAYARKNGLIELVPGRAASWQITNAGRMASGRQSAS